jgi:hypothetical protein
MPHRARYFK